MPAFILFAKGQVTLFTMEDGTNRSGVALPKPKDVVATVHEMQNGRYHYDLPRDMSDGARFKKTTARMSNAQRLDPAVDGSPIKAKLSLVETGSKSSTVTKKGLVAVARDANNEIRKALGDRVKLRLGERAFDFGAGYESLDGYCINGTIGVALDADDAVGVARHEVIHALRDPKVFGGTHGAFSKAEWQTLVRAACKNKALRDRIARNYADLSDAAQIEEAVAEL